MSLHYDVFYMPPCQRDLIAWVAAGPSLRAECARRGLEAEYGEAVAGLAQFRTQHLVLVSRYITAQVSTTMLLDIV